MTRWQVTVPHTCHCSSLFICPPRGKWSSFGVKIICLDRLSLPVPVPVFLSCAQLSGKSLLRRVFRDQTISRRK